MASPGDKKEQLKGSCGHIMAACRDIRIVEDNCVLDKPCPICDGFFDAQKELLATPSYRIRKDKKAGLLMSPKDGTVISSVDTEPTFQSTKERIKSQSVIEQNKACQMCMLCKSMCFCPSCSQCLQCCHRTECRGESYKVFGKFGSLGANPRVVSVLREGYSLPFKQRPLLTRFPLVQSGYANPVKNRFLKEALFSLMNKLVVEKVVVKSSLAFYNWLFLVPKPNRKWRPFLDLSQLNLYLSTNTLKMQTPETIQLSLQTGEWVTSLDFSDTYFHIPINHRSQKYQVFPVQSNLSIHSSSLWSGHSSPRVYQSGQGSEAYGSSKGYPDPPVPRRLVAESPVPGNLPTTYPDPLGPLLTVRVGCQHEKVRTNPTTGLQL